MSDALAEALLGAVVRAGGSRQVVAATAVALWRAGRAVSAQAADEKEVLEEIEARIEMIKPVIGAKVRAAHDEVKVNLTGEDKAIRNVAERALFGEGVAALPKDGKEAKRRQRGRRRAGATLRAAASSSPGSDQDPEKLRDIQRAAQEVAALHKQLASTQEAVDEAIQQAFDEGIFDCASFVVRRLVFLRLGSVRSLVFLLRRACCPGRAKATLRETRSALDQRKEAEHQAAKLGDAGGSGGGADRQGQLQSALRESDTLVRSLRAELQSTAAENAGHVGRKGGDNSLVAAAGRPTENKAPTLGAWLGLACLFAAASTTGAERIRYAGQRATLDIQEVDDIRVERITRSERLSLRQRGLRFHEVKDKHFGDKFAEGLRKKAEAASLFEREATGRRLGDLSGDFAEDVPRQGARTSDIKANARSAKLATNASSSAGYPPLSFSPVQISAMACVQFDLDLTLISGGIFPGLIGVGLSGEVRQIPGTKCFGWNLELFLQISIGFEIGSLPFRISFVMISTLSVQEQPLDIARGELMWELPYGYDTSVCHTSDPFTLVERTLTEHLFVGPSSRPRSCPAAASRNVRRTP
ncbi:unnamed protein product [Prorocentrum cordatum]|uniref:Uncharacterized protein n=1 Tax=Prorocentrum cordatum TaxID=2364126 RepID=A0ABN9Q8W4_9DINO|nr:unnamed protein product [Polarella glacialis]